ncbi:MAG TPA: hypothetical protein VF634_13570, partial [Pyrinomonadaceae bacterium]
ELRDVRATAIAQGGTPSIPMLPRNAISNILRGRIEELTGMALLGQGKTTEAVAALRRAVSVLPEKSLYWRTAQWRLGTALATSGQERDALAAYIKGYNSQSPDPARRAVIEALYTKVNGSSAGLDAQVGSAPARAATFEATNANSPASSTSTPAPTETPAPATPAVAATPEPSPLRTPDAAVSPTQTPEPSTSATPQTSATPAASPEPSAIATTTPAAPAPSNANAEPNAPAASPVEAKQTRVSENGCALVLSASALELSHSGGSASVVARLEGSDKLADVRAATTNWSDIIVLREPQGSAGTNSLKFTITSISKTGGNFIVNFKSPCGAHAMTVTVR